MLAFTMKEYLTYAPFSIFLVWVYIVIQSFKSFREFKKASGKTYTSLLNPLLLQKLKQETRDHKELQEAYILHKRKSKKLFLIWILCLVIFMIVSFVVGLVTAGNK